MRIWGTFPTEPVQGFMLSHYFHLLLDDEARLSLTLHPPDLILETAARAVAPEDVDQRLISEFVDFSVEIPDDAVPWQRDLVERALVPDMTYERAGTVLRKAYDPPFFATYFYGLDVVGHTFMRFGRPDRFGDVTSQQARRYGRVLDRYTAHLSGKVGELLEGLRQDEILLVVSTYGMEPVPLWRRLLRGFVGGSTMTGTHARAPDGVVLAFGSGIRAGSTLRDASILDLAPTVLYLMGLPVAREMEGRVLTEMLEEDFARAHPVTFIPSYESLAVSPMADPLSLDLPPAPRRRGLLSSLARLATCPACSRGLARVTIRAAWPPSTIFWASTFGSARFSPPVFSGGLARPPTVSVSTSASSVGVRRRWAIADLYDLDDLVGLQVNGRRQSPTEDRQRLRLAGSGADRGRHQGWQRAPDSGEARARRREDRVKRPPGWRERQVLMDRGRLARTLARMAAEIAEHHPAAAEPVLVGIQTRGVPLARRLARQLERVAEYSPPVGALDITLYRDDLTTIASQPVIKGTGHPRVHRRPAPSCWSMTCSTRAAP